VFYIKIGCVGEGMCYGDDDDDDGGVAVGTIGVLFCSLS